MRMTNKMDIYSWAAPTEEQKKMFNALGDEEQLAMLREALAESEKSGLVENFSMDQLINELDREEQDSWTDITSNGVATPRDVIHVIPEPYHRACFLEILAVPIDHNMPNEDHRWNFNDN